jgi:hypothetical protein
MFRLLITFIELKELIQIHEDSATHGGDLKHDTVTIIGATLDLQEKVVKHVGTRHMNPLIHPVDPHYSGHDPYQRRFHALHRRRP